MDKREILKKLAAEAAHGELNFQTNAAVTLRIQRAIDDPDAALSDIAKLVQAEPVLAARVVAVANSAAFNTSGRSFTDVRSAVSRLGLRTLRSLATAFLVRQLADSASKDPEQKRMAGQLWEHTAHVTSLAHLLARRVTQVDGDAALFMGVVHEVGGFFLLARAKEHPGLFQGNAADWNEDEVLELKTDLDRAVLKGLAVPDTVLAAMDDFWQGYLAMPPHTLGDTLLLANDLAPVVSPFQQLGTTGQDVAAEAAAKIELVVGSETLSEILRESAEEVASLVAALKL